MQKVFKPRPKSPKNHIWWVQNLLLGLFLTILATMTLHTFFTTWIGSNFSSSTESWIKGWKEILLLGTIPLFAYVFYVKPKILKTLLTRRINQLILAYFILHLVIWIWQRPHFNAAVVGLVFNLRFLALFIYAQVLTELFDSKKLRKISLKVTILAAVPVVVFGAMQVLILRDNILENFGYSKNTIQAFQLIDDNPDAVRINSTLRGPNPLGAYLASFSLIALAGVLTLKKQAKWIWLLAPLTLITLWGSQSRSAWLGLAVGGGLCAIYFAIKNPKYRKIIFTPLLIAAILLPMGIYSIRDTNFYRQTLLHNLPDDRPQSGSDIERANHQKRARKLISENAWGYGPGTAGTQSYYSDEPLLTENYYYQNGVELGYLGITLFGLITIFAFAWLWPHREDPLALALIGGLIATSIINLFLHGWTDETLAFMWWGLAGLYKPND